MAWRRLLRLFWDYFFNQCMRSSSSHAASCDAVEWMDHSQRASLRKADAGDEKHFSTSTNWGVVGAYTKSRVFPRHLQRRFTSNAIYSQISRALLQLSLPHANAHCDGPITTPPAPGTAAAQTTSHGDGAPRPARGPLEAQPLQPRRPHRKLRPQLLPNLPHEMALPLSVHRGTRQDSRLQYRPFVLVPSQPSAVVLTRCVCRQ